MDTEGVNIYKGKLIERCVGEWSDTPYSGSIPEWECGCGAESPEDCALSGDEDHIEADDRRERARDMRSVK